MIVSYDEHEVNNTFKFGVIYQKFRQVSGARAVLQGRIPAARALLRKCGSLELKYGPTVDSVTCTTLCCWVSSLITHFLLLGCFPSSLRNDATEKIQYGNQPTGCWREKWMCKWILAGGVF